MLQYVTNAPEGTLKRPLTPGCDSDYGHGTSVSYMT